VAWPKRPTTIIEFTCGSCGKLTSRPKHGLGKGRFCSRRCSARYGSLVRERTGRVEVPCSGCGYPFLKWRNDASKSVLHFHNRVCRRTYYQTNATGIGLLRDQVWDRDGGKCVDCGGVRYLETHHVQGRTNRLDNLILVCKKCHVARHIILNGGRRWNAGRPA